MFDEDTFMIINKNTNGIVILKGCLDGKIAFKFDKDKEYVDGTFNKFLEENKIKDEYPYAHEQNGFIECDNQVVMEVRKNILHVKGLLTCPWAKVTNTIVHVLNKTMTEVLDAIFSLDATHDMNIMQYDVKTTYGGLQKEIYITFRNFVTLVLNGISRLIFFLTKYNLVISDANPCVYRNNECIELSLGFLSMMELHVPLMNPSSWTCCAIYVDILRLINDLAMIM
ncbi:unnamed protein product [Sphagnum jensenii]|uniref:Reverse transcriptase Ty1/copia-type domain-containing protein n=1 Tax=Sphagnum jensenii TaxID=128206 RepID=A0ABP0VSC1_9BRYO